MMSLAGGKEAAEVMGACVPGPRVEQSRHRTGEEDH